MSEMGLGRVKTSAFGATVEHLGSSTAQTRVGECIFYISPLHEFAQLD